MTAEELSALQDANMAKFKDAGTNPGQAYELGRLDEATLTHGKVEAAVAEERERCATVSENYKSSCGHACWHAIAVEIRKPPC